MGRISFALNRGVLSLQQSNQHRRDMSQGAVLCRSAVPGEVKGEAGDRESRYAFACFFPGAGQRGCGVAKYDVRSGARQLLSLPEGVMAGEPCFVPDPKGTAEDHGWLLAYVTDLRSYEAELWILDATRIEAGPVAAIELPVWVPAGVHGSWIDDLAI